MGSFQLQAETVWHQHSIDLPVLIDQDIIFILSTELNKRDLQYCKFILNNRSPLHHISAAALFLEPYIKVSHRAFRQGFLVVEIYREIK